MENPEKIPYAIQFKNILLDSLLKGSWADMVIVCYGEEILVKYKK